MPVRFPLGRLTAPASLLAGVLVVALAAPPKLPAGDQTPCTSACTGCSRARPASAEMDRRTYQVADLVIPLPVKQVPPKGGDASPADGRCTQEDCLIRLIVNTVEPESWDARGGAGTIDYHPATMGLVIRQTPAVHEKIQELLESLRRLQDQEVALEIRIITMDEAGFRRLDLSGKDAPLADDASASPLRVRFFDDAQVRSLLEAAQENVRINVMQAPKLTLLNGQCSVLDVTEPKRFLTGVTVAAGEDGHPVVTPHTEEVPVGLRMTARPIISADHRLVKVSLGVNMSDLEDADAAATVEAALKQLPADQVTPAALRQLVRQPKITRLAMDSTFAVPDGGTALISGWKREREARRECATPVLSDIPYVNRLFTNVGCGRETECVLLMVTPRVIVQQEEEERAAGKTPEDLHPCPPKEAPCTSVKRCGCAEAAELVAKYHRACAEGRADEATRLAVQALAVDPACFHAAPAEHTKDR
jgi:hypothetical protein